MLLKETWKTNSKCIEFKDQEKYFGRVSTAAIECCIFLCKQQVVNGVNKKIATYYVLGSRETKRIRPNYILFSAPPLLLIRSITVYSGCQVSKEF